jgi:SAM-dependent methyltransferase
MARQLTHVRGVRRSELEDFLPFDTIPWAAQAEQLLSCPNGDGFMGLRPGTYVDDFVAWVQHASGLAPGALVADIGCGPGMFSLRLAAAGYRVVGFDIAPALVAHANAEARSRGLAAEHHRQSLQSFDVAEPPALVLIINSVLNQLAPDELREALARVREKLAPGGHLLVELRLAAAAHQANARRDTLERSLMDRSPFSPRKHLWIERTLFFDEQKQAVTHHVIVEPDGATAEYWSRSHLYDRHEIDDFLRQAGFRAREWYGPRVGAALSDADEACIVWAARSD